MFFDAIVFNVRKDKIVRKCAVYVALGVDANGMKDVLALVLCADGLSSIKKAIQAAFPLTEYQRCIVHMVRNTLLHVSDKYLKTIYHAHPMRKSAMKICCQSRKKWNKRNETMG